MSIDLSQFHQVFFEESSEGLDTMEAALVELDPAGYDAELLNSVFRAAHSIKGGAGTFGFTGICEFTHVLETLLDQIRANTRPLRNEHLTLLLEAVDCLRELLAMAQAGLAQQNAHSLQLSQAFAALLADAPASTFASADTSSDPSQKVPAEQTWQVSFAPHADILLSGNDPLRLCRELQALGADDIECDTSALPNFHLLDPESLHLKWNISGFSGVALASIQEVFEWVEDECDLTIVAAAKQTNQLSDCEPLILSPNPTADIPQTTTKTTENTFIRVSIDKIDLLINMVGELVITQSMLGQISNEVDISKLPRLMEGLSQLEQNTRELQDGVMRIRMLPISFAFNRFPRLVKDLGQKLGKNITLEMTGEHTELDKTVMEKIGDPLVHLVRNAIDHGIEEPQERIAKGKSATGKIMLNAYHKGGDVVIVIRDDGAGLNSERILQKALEKNLLSQEQAASLEQAQIFDLIFQPGFSTAKEITDLSGRGVGMDVVRKNIQALNGTVDIHSEQGKGSTITIRLPLTLAILDGQLVRVGDSIYVFPLVSIVESMQCKQQFVNCLAGGQNVFRLRDEYVPIIDLSVAFGIRTEPQTVDGALMVVVETDGIKAGVIVDELLSQQQVVIKSLEHNYKKVEGVSGATILGDGTVALIVDVQSIVKLFNKKFSSKPGIQTAAFGGAEISSAVRVSHGM